MSELGHSHGGAAEDGGLTNPPGYTQGSHHILTPVDGNTVFGPDSYSAEHPSGRNITSPPASQSQPALGDPSGFHVGQHEHANPPRENPRSHPRSRTPTTESQENSPPQIPPLNFSYPGVARTNQDLAAEYRNPSYRASYQPASTAAKARSDLELSQPRSVLHNPSIQAELSADKSPVESAYGNHSALYGRDSLQPRLDSSQRVSTDYTWSPSVKPGAFI